MASVISFKHYWAEPGTPVVQGITDERLTIDALEYEYNHDARTQSPRLSAASLQLAVGRCGLGPREQEEQRTQRASFVATYHTKVHTEQQLIIVLGSDAWLKKIPREAPRHVSSRPD